jgi:cytochrome P450
VQMGSLLTGIDLEGRDTLTRLVDLLDPLNNGDALRWAESPEQKLAIGLAALEEFKQDYFLPSLARRQALVVESATTRRSESAIPIDMMTLVAQEADPAWGDVGNALRNVLQFLLGASHTNVHPLGHAIDELSSWLARHPVERASVDDPRFLAQSLNEVMRLHPIGPFLWRIASVDLELESGTPIAAGSRVAIDINAANSDPNVYGPDADEFNPYREKTQAGNEYGLAFGAGAHMCPGIPFVLGANGTDGGVVQALRMLLACGARPDPQTPARRSEGYRDTYLQYPMLVTPDALPAATA